jgi:hypothetical protein
MRDQGGQSAVELTLILPLLLVLVFLVFEVGRLFGSWLLVTNAAREGARYGAVQCVPANALGIPATCPSGTDPTASIKQRAQQTASFLVVQTATPCDASGNPVAPATSCVSVQWSADNSVIVTVAYQVKTLMPITGNVPFLGTINYPGYVPLAATSTMHAEQ